MSTAEFPDVYRAADDRYATMPYRRSGTSGLQLPAITLGLWHNFGDDRPLDTQRAILRRAFDRGVTHFDLANNYGPPPGAAEENVGRLLASDFRPYRDELVVSSKAGWRMQDGPYGFGGSRKYLVASCDASLRRLGLDYVDIFYHHRPDPQTPVEETVAALDHLVRSGRALYVGISSYSPELTRRATAVARDLGTPLTIHQPSYSMFNRHVEDGLLDVAEQIGIGIAAFSPLQQGLLTNRYMSGVPQGSRAQGASPSLTERQVKDADYQARVRGLSEIAHERGQSLAQLALAWALRHPAVTTALVGASSVHQLEQNLGTLKNLEFDDEELDRIDEFAIDGTGS